jgi:hypothetical protein
MAIDWKLAFSVAAGLVIAGVVGGLVAAVMGGRG